MSHRNLVEDTVFLTINHIKTNIAAALAGVRTNRADAEVTTPPPKKYFYYSEVKGYQTPAIFVVPEDIDFRKKEKMANHINAAVRVNVVALVEDRDTKHLTLKAWRYQAALQEILDQARIEDAANKVMLTIVVTGASFSAIYGEVGDLNIPKGLFRKEAILECEINHFEKI